jgi:hypothetical protein
MSSIATPQIASVSASAPVTPVQLQLSQALGQMIGQVLDGTVIALLNDTTLRLQTQSGLLDVATETPLPTGTAVAIAVQGTAQEPRIVITPVSDAARQLPAQQAEAASESAVEQIGARTAGTNSAATSSTTTASASSSADAAVPSDPPNATARTAPSPPLTQAAQSTAAAIVRSAAATQGSLASLYADLEAVVTAPTPSAPAPVLDAAKLLLAMRLNFGSGEEISSDQIRTALTRSGLTSAAPIVQASAPRPATNDIGTALVSLRQSLKTWLDQESDAKTASFSSLPITSAQTPVRTNIAMPAYRGPLNPQPLATVLLAATAAPVREQTTHPPPQAAAAAAAESQPPHPPPAPQAPGRGNAPVPPYRGSPGVAQAPVPSSLSPTAPPREQAAHLLAETDAAIARQILLHVASLPGDPATSAQHSDNANSTRVMVEIPLATPLGTGIVPMTIERDGSKEHNRERAVSYLARFSIDLPSIGPVHVRVALTGERAAVTLNVERADSAALLAADLPLLDAGLRGAQIEPGELRCLVGSPAENSATAGRAQTAAPGQFLDQAS